MSVETLPPVIRRILVALDASAGSTAALEGAALLAARLNADLLGLFVEDEDLLRLAALPFAQEVEIHSARTRPMQAEDMEQRLRAQAHRAEQALSTAADRHRLRWEFRVVRGGVTEELLAAIAEADLAALGGIGGGAMRTGQMGRTAWETILRAERPVLLLAPGRTIREPIAVVYNRQPAARDALALAGHLAKNDGGTLLVLLVAPSPKEEKDLLQAARKQTDAAGVQARFRALGQGSPAALLDAVRTEGVGTAILPSEEEAQSSELARLLVEEQDCAVIVVR
jgi:nucleotide-binding universal stress UspA family protein